MLLIIDVAFFILLTAPSGDFEFKQFIHIYKRFYDLIGKMSGSLGTMDLRLLQSDNR